MFTFKIDKDGFVHSKEFQFFVAYQVEFEGEMVEDEASVKVVVKEDMTDVDVSVTSAPYLNDADKKQICDHVRNEVNSGNVHLPTFIPMDEIEMGNWEGYYHSRQTPEETEA